MKKHSWKIIGGAAILLLLGSIVYAQQAAKSANEGINLEPHIKGNAEAKVTLTEYSDFQCPACGQFYPILKTVMEDYGDQIRFEYRHFPLITIHPHAASAARAAEAAGQQGKFWEMHDMLFENQTTWSNSSNPTAVFVGYAEELGLDTATFKRHMNASVITNAVNDSFNEARGLGFTGTPSFQLNGERMTFETYDDFISQIEAAIGITPEEEVVDEESTGSNLKFGI